MNNTPDFQSLEEQDCFTADIRHQLKGWLSRMTTRTKPAEIAAERRDRVSEVIDARAKRKKISSILRTWKPGELAERVSAASEFGSKSEAFVRGQEIILKHAEKIIEQVRKGNIGLAKISLENFEKLKKFRKVKSETKHDDIWQAFTGLVNDEMSLRVALGDPVPIEKFMQGGFAMDYLTPKVLGTVPAEIRESGPFQTIVHQKLTPSYEASNHFSPQAAALLASQYLEKNVLSEASFQKLKQSASFQRALRNLIYQVKDSPTDIQRISRELIASDLIDGESVNEYVLLSDEIQRPLRRKIEALAKKPEEALALANQFLEMGLLSDEGAKETFRSDYMRRSFEQQVMADPALADQFVRLNLLSQGRVDQIVSELAN